MDLKELKSKATLMELALIETIELSVKEANYTQILDEFCRLCRTDPPPGCIVAEARMWLERIEIKLRKHLKLS